MKEWNYENDQWTKLPIYLRHLPLITRHFDIFSLIVRNIWANFLKYFFFRFFIYLKVKGDFHSLYKKYPKLLIISNHSSHLDAVSIAAAIPFRYWINLYFAAAKDYFFSNVWMSYFSKHCIGAIPIDRKSRNGEAVKICLTLLEALERAWLVMYPEGTRTKDGKIHAFKRGISMFSTKTNTPILFLYIENAYELFPRGQAYIKPGIMTVHVGPVHEPASIDMIYENYKRWVNTIKPNQFADDVAKT